MVICSSMQEHAVAQQTMKGDEQTQLAHAHAHTSGSGCLLTARHVQRRLGWAVQVAPSGVDHPLAGNGLWLAGKAGAGAVVALYPGIVYQAAHYR